MAERFSMAEIESRFPSEHVLLDQPETDENLKVLGGIVVFHSKDENEVAQGGRIAVEAHGLSLHRQDSRQRCFHILMPRFIPGRGPIIVEECPVSSSSLKHRFRLRRPGPRQLRGLGQGLVPARFAPRRLRLNKAIGISAREAS